MRFKRLILCICLMSTFAWLGALPKQVQACGGGESGGILADYRDSDIFAKGRVIETDDVGQNVVVQIEGYYKGNGPQNILWMRQSREYLDWLVMGYIECVSWKQPLLVNDNIYFFASRRQDGSYYNISRRWSYDTVYRFNTPEDVNRVELDEELTGGNYESPTTYNEHQFLELLTKSLGKLTLFPPTDMSYPFPAPLLISTSKSTYMLPIDGKVPIKLDEEFLRKTERCFTKDCDVVEASTGISVRLNIISNIEAGNNAAYVAPRGGIVARWIETGIEIETFKFYIEFAKKSVLLDKEQNEAALKLAERAQWSPDGRFFAYNDSKGLWVWDVYTENAKPRLVRPVDKNGIMPFARYFSPKGRMLAITEGEVQSTLDLKTGKTYPDGIVSSDDRWFFIFGNRDSKTGVMEVTVCEIKESPCSGKYEPYKPRELTAVKQIKWIGDNHFVVLLRDWDAPAVEEAQEPFDISKGYYLVQGLVTDIDIVNMIQSGSPGKNTVIRGTSFESLDKTIAVIKNKSTLIINKHEYNLGSYLDGDIVSIKWLPAYLYQRLQ